MAYIDCTYISDSSISIFLNGLDTNYSLSDRYAVWFIGPDPWTTTDWSPHIYIPAYASSGGAYTFTGLTGSTYYYISCNVMTNNGWVQIDPVYLQTSQSRPPFFSWTYPKISGGYFNLTADEWNALEANINAVRQYKGYLYYWFTNVSRGQFFTANHYNEIVYGIQDMYGYGSQLLTHFSGDTIMASYMNDLVDAINSVY